MVDHTASTGVRRILDPRNWSLTVQFTVFTTVVIAGVLALYSYLATERIDALPTMAGLVLVVALLSFAMAALITRPLARQVEAVERVADGDLSFSKDDDLVSAAGDGAPQKAGELDVDRMAREGLERNNAEKLKLAHQIAADPGVVAALLRSGDLAAVNQLLVRHMASCADLNYLFILDSKGTCRASSSARGSQR